MVGQVAVWVTRVSQGILEVVVDAASGRVLTCPLQDDEHPCEAAWRTVTLATGQDTFLAFRKLPVAAPQAAAAAGAWHVFQAAPESELVLPPALSWRPLAVAAGVDATFGPALAALGAG